MALTISVEINFFCILLAIVVWQGFFFRACPNFIYYPKFVRGLEGERYFMSLLADQLGNNLVFFVCGVIFLICSDMNHCMKSNFVV